MKKNSPSPSSRRDFVRTLGAGVGAALLASHIGAPSLAAAEKTKRRLKIGHTGITWTNEEVTTAISDCASLGYDGFETFGWVAEPWEQKGGLGPVLVQNKLPLISEYCTIDLVHPEKRKAEIEKMIRWGHIIKKLGGTVCVVGPASVPRATYDFAANKANIVSTLNEVSKALTDIGITPALHPHTDTAVMTRDEVYAVLESADTKVLKFCPDVGQLAKAGADPVPIVRDFLSIVRHAHVKDYSGGDAWLGYCPLGQGKVDLKTIMDLLEKADMSIAMVELDLSKNAPLSGHDAARVAKEYLQSLGYTFRS